MSVVENGAVSLGSASWNGAADYETGGEFHERATAFFAAVKWDVLISLCSSLRNGIPCEFGERFSIGHFNMVRRIIFEDGISWVARLNLPSLRAAFGDQEVLERPLCLKVEIASMKFLKYVMIGLRLGCVDLMSPRKGPRPLSLFQMCTAIALIQPMTSAPRMS